MKHIVLSFIGFVLSLATFAANPTNAPHPFCDFESPNTLPASAFHIPDGGAVDVSIVANPSPTGLNTSNTVLKIISPSGANWGGAIFNEVSHGEDLMMNLYQVQKVTGYDLVSFLMYREDNTHVPQLKTVDIDDDGHTSVNYLDLVPLSVDGDENYVANHTITTHQWQRVVYSVTHCHNSGIHFIYIMPDREGSSTVYIDDIIFEKDDEKPVMVSASCGTATGTTLSLYVSATDDLSDPVNKFLVSTDGNKAHAQECTATNGIITVTGLTPNTSYTFTVWAKDYAGNVSDNFKTTTCSTQSPQQGDWCQKTLTSGGHTIYVSCEDIGSYYRFTVESDEAIYGFGGTFFNPGATDLRTTIVSQTTSKIVCEIYTSTAPSFYTPLYVMMPGEVMFTAIQNANITWGVCEEEPQCQPSTGDTTAYVCAGTNFYWQGELSFDGDQRTFTNSAGCDSIVTLHLNYLQPTTGDTTAYVCAGENFYWHGELSQDGAQLTFTNAAGCDSVVTLHITINQPTTGEETQHVCAGTPYYWYGELAQDGATRTLTNAANCDSIVTLHLIEDNFTTSDTTAYICAGTPFYWHGNLAHDGDQLTFTNAAGCDSIVTLHLTVNQPTTGDTTAYVCAGENFYWHGELSQDGAQLTFTNAAGCDSVVTLHITINQPTTGEETQHVCAGTPYYWYGELAQDGATRTLTNAAGCDSIVTLHLIEDNFTTSDTTATICAGTPFYWRGELSHDGDQLTFTNAAGCDSIVTLHLTVKQTSASDTAANVCAGEDFYWRGELAHDGDQLTFTNAAGCDSIVTLHLIIDNCAPACEDIIMRKWDDLIFIGNGEGLYVSYQWYRDGQVLTGETGQYLYIMGYTLENDGHTYSARAYKADGTYIEACSKSFTDFQRSAELYPGDHSAVQTSPNPARRFMPVKIEGLEEEAHFVVYSVLGQRVAEISSDTFVAEWPVGYYLIYSLDSEHPWTGKLLVY